MFLQLLIPLNKFAYLSVSKFLKIYNKHKLISNFPLSYVKPRNCVFLLKRKMCYIGDGGGHIVAGYAKKKVFFQVIMLRIIPFISKLVIFYFTCTFLGQSMQFNPDGKMMHYPPQKNYLQLSSYGVLLYLLCKKINKKRDMKYNAPPPPSPKYN